MGHNLGHRPCRDWSPPLCCRDYLCYGDLSTVTVAVPPSFWITWPISCEKRVFLYPATAAREG
jgi:hypothetical protein